MLKNHTILLSIFLLSLLAACKKDQTSKPLLQKIPIEKDAQLTKYKLSKSGTLKLKKDKPYLDISDSYQSFTSSEENYLAIYEYLGRSFSLFNLETKEEVSSFKVNTEGPDSFGALDDCLGFYMENLDSIFFFNPAAMALVCTNLNGKVFYKKDLARATENLELRPEITTFHPAIKKEKYWYIPVKIDNPSSPVFSKLPTVIVYEERAKTLDPKKNLFKLPKLYDEGFWGFESWKYRSTYIEYQGGYLVSFPNTHDLYLYNMDGKLMKTRAMPSSYIKRFKPLKGGRILEKMFNGEVSISSEENDDYVLTSSEYGNLFALGKYFVRVAHIKPSLNEYRAMGSPKALSPDYHFILFDEDLNYLGETYLEGKEYFYSQSFLIDEKIYILNNIATEKNEDYLIFDYFEIRS